MEFSEDKIGKLVKVVADLQQYVGDTRPAWTAIFGEGGWIQSGTALPQKYIPHNSIGILLEYSIYSDGYFILFEEQAFFMLKDSVKLVEECDIIN